MCAVVIHYRPEWAAPITLLDSSLNVGVLILSLFVTYCGMVDTYCRCAADTSVAMAMNRAMLRFKFISSSSCTYIMCPAS